MKKNYTLLLLLAMTLLGVATQTKAQAPLMEPSIDLTFITEDENAALLIRATAPTDGCWIDLNGDGQCQDSKGSRKKCYQPTQESNQGNYLRPYHLSQSQ